MALKKEELERRERASATKQRLLVSAVDGAHHLAQIVHAQVRLQRVLILFCTLDRLI